MITAKPAPSFCATNSASRFPTGTVLLSCLLTWWLAEAASAQPIIVPPFTTDYMRGLFDSVDANSLRPDLDLGRINVKDNPYLAKGDGVTDDTAAIQAAIDAAEAVVNAENKSPVVHLPAGIYQVSNLTLFAPCILRGDSMKSSILRMITGSTGTMMTDEGNAQGITIEDLQINGNGCTANGLVLGYGTHQHGGGGSASRLWIRNFDGDGVTTGLGWKVNGNACFYRQIDVSGDVGQPCKAIINGTANQYVQLLHTGEGDYGIEVYGLGNVFLGTHLEGAYTTAGIRVDGDNNQFIGVTQTVGDTSSCGPTFSFASGEYGNMISNLTVYLEPGGAISSLISDTSYGTRTVPGFQGASANHLFVPFYTNGRERALFQGSVSGPPTTGTWRVGDMSYMREVAAGEPAWYSCTTAGTPGTWSPLSTLPGATAKTADYHIGGRAASNANETGKRFSNAGAEATVTFTLRPVAVADEYEFVNVVSGQVLRVDPNDTQIFFGQGAGKYLELDQGERVRIGYGEAGAWYIINQVGTPAYEAP